MANTLLSTEDLSKAFGGISAVDNVFLGVDEGTIHAIIGPNGAGKTTLISLLSGSLLADHGRIMFRHKDITKLTFAQRAKTGLARSFQITSVILPMTLQENVMLAVQGRQKHAYRFWQPFDNNTDIRAQALQTLEEVGLSQKHHQLAGNISHGEQRQLELAMALAMEPKLLLLDEPMAGMGQAESERITELLKNIAQEKTILLIEHDMNAVFSLADTISVLVNGRIIASDKPAAIRANPDVQSAYLGESIN